MTHQERMQIVEQFCEAWENHVGRMFICPSQGQLRRWCKIARWDLGLLTASVEDLRSRAKHPMDESDPFRHALNHFSASLVRRVRGRYGADMERAA